MVEPRAKTGQQAQIQRQQPANSGSPRRKYERGNSVGRYVILDKVGSGGFGDVYSAYDQDLDRKIAVKIMKTSQNKLGTAREQLSREAQALAKLSHENVLTVYDFGDVDGDVFLAMEFVDGHTLKEWFAQQDRTWREVVDVMIEAGRGLEAAHNSGIVHSDFKPQNVLIDRGGQIRVADFGLAKVLRQEAFDALLADQDGEIRVRRETMIPQARSEAERGRRPSAAGSPAYMAPEQFQGRDVNERSDQFSFGVTLFEGLYGRRPYPQRTIRELKAAVLAGAFDPPPEDSDVPRWLRDIVLRTIAHNPQERFLSMEDALAALSDDPTLRRKRILRTAFTVGVTALATMGVAAVLLHEPSNEEQQHIETLRERANAAAAANYYVVPPVEKPEYKTAYKTILELEDLNAGYDPLADEVALSLRETFSQTLTRIGDYYWGAEYGRPFALDYYAHAYILDPSNEKARARSSITPGQLHRAAVKAKNSSYTHHELLAAEPLNALAARKVKDRAKALRAIQKRGRGRSFSTQARLDLMTSVTEAMAKRPTKKKRPDQSQDSFDQALPADNSALVKGQAKQVAKPVRKVAEAPKQAQQKPPSDPALAPGKGGSKSGTGASTSKSSGRDLDRGSISASEGARAVMEGRSLLARGKFEQAAQAFHRALRANRRNSAALMGLSDTYFERGQYQKAVSYGERAVAVNGRTSSYRWKLGDAYVRVLRYKDAAQQYKKGAKLGSRKAKRRLQALQRKLGE